MVLAEGTLRVADWLGSTNELRAWQRQSAHELQLTNGRHVLLGEMVRPAANADIVYELVPDMDVHFGGKHVVTGALGFRGGDPPPERDPCELCVVGIGDSVLFGSGVETDETFLHRLGDKLQTLYPDRIVTTVNTGVPGYNTTMEVATLAQKCLDLQPDLVIVDFVENDFDLPNFLLLPPDPLRTDRLLLYDLAHRTLRKGRRPNGPLEDAPMENHHFFVGDPARVPTRYQHMVGHDSYRRALQRLLALADEHGFRVVVSCHTAIDEPAQQICDELSVPVVTAAARQREWLDARGQQLMQSELVVSPSDPHPSAIGHRLLAEELFVFVRLQGWFD